MQLNKKDRVNNDAKICKSPDKQYTNCIRRLFLVSTILALLILHCRGQNNPPLNSKHPNVHKIVVKDVIQTTSYTYVQGAEKNRVLWIAIPKMETNAGETYYFYGGLEMRGFKSKELDRTFSSILFLNGLISPDLVEGAGGSSNVSPQKTEVAVEESVFEIDPAAGGITIAELFSNREKYQGKIVKIRAKVTKCNSRILSRNWVHLQDGTGNSGNFDLTATTSEVVKVGDVITVEGMISLDKDFGAGYFFSIIMENSRIVDSFK